MRIDLQCEDVEARSGLRDYVARRMRGAIGQFREHIEFARIKVADVTGEGGGADKRCVVRLRLRNLPDVVFAITEIEVRTAVDRAAERLAKVLAQRLARIARPAGGLACAGA